MAIARKIDPAALARAFADEISAVPEVKRLWYRAGPSYFDDGRLSLDFDVLVDRLTDGGKHAVVDALTRLHTQYFDDVGMTLLFFSLAADEPSSLDDMGGGNAIELPLREA